MTKSPVGWLPRNRDCALLLLFVIWTWHALMTSEVKLSIWNIIVVSCWCRWLAHVLSILFFSQFLSCSFHSSCTWIIHNGTSSQHCLTSTLHLVLFTNHLLVQTPLVSPHCLYVNKSLQWRIRYEYLLHSLSLSVAILANEWFSLSFLSHLLCCITSYWKLAVSWVMWFPARRHIGDVLVCISWVMAASDT